MSLIAILIIILVIGGVAYIIKQAPIDPIWKNIAYIVLALFLIIYLLRLLQGSGIDMKL